MAIKASEYVWHNGHLVPWDDAKIHVMAHVVNYGSSVFEGIRCYQTQKGPAIFRLQDHTLRLLQSCKIYRIDVDYSLEELVQAQVSLVAANKVSPCYIRPIVLRGYGQVGVVAERGEVFAAAAEEGRVGWIADVLDCEPQADGRGCLAGPGAAHCLEELCAIAEEDGGSRDRVPQ